MSNQAHSGASTGSAVRRRKPARKPARKIGPHEAAARRLRIAVKKTDVGPAVVGLADSGVNLGRELDEWDNEVPGRAAQLQEYGRALRETAKYASGEVEVPDDRLEALKALVRRPKEDNDGGT